MPTYDQASRIIESYLDTNWTFTPIAYENVPPMDLSDPQRPILSKGTDPYIAVNLFYNDSGAAEVGVAPLKRTWGNLAIDFHTREGKGATANTTNIDNLCNLFEYTTISDIVFKNMTILRPVTAEGWYITPTMLRFYFNR